MPSVARLHMPRIRQRQPAVTGYPDPTRGSTGRARLARSTFTVGNSAAMTRLRRRGAAAPGGQPVVTKLPAAQPCPGAGAAPRRTSVVPRRGRTEDMLLSGAPCRAADASLQAELAWAEAKHAAAQDCDAFA